MTELIGKQLNCSLNSLEFVPLHVPEVLSIPIGIIHLENEEMGLAAILAADHVRISLGPKHAVQQWKCVLPLVSSGLGTSRFRWTSIVHFQCNEAAPLLIKGLSTLAQYYFL